MERRPPDDELRSQLEEWDPADRAGPPAPATLARIRQAMLDASPAFSLPARLVWATAGLALAAAIAWQVSLSPTDPVALVNVSPSVRVQYHASNGTRIYWTVQAVGSETRNRGEGDE